MTLSTSSAFSLWLCFWAVISASQPLALAEGGCIDLELQRLGAQFLHRRNPTLHLDPEVESAARKLLAPKDRQVAEKKIAAWLALIERAHAGKTDNVAAMRVIKNHYYRKHVITDAEFPESYFELQRRIAREQGHGEITITPGIRRQLMDTAIEDQRRSLDAWIEYLHSDDALYPGWVKVWAFEGIVNRARGTVGPFTALNQGALSLTIERMEGYLKVRAQGGKEWMKLWIAAEPDAELRALILGGKFQKIYDWHVQKLASQSTDLRVTEGTWVRYPKRSDAKPLALSCQATNWCTAGESTAARQLQGGDFHVYYSLDATGRPTQPRLAIRMQGDEIAEVRGIGANQGLDSAIAGTPILDKKLREFGAQGEKYKKRSADMRYLTEIERKNQKGEPLTREDLRFLYELPAPIEGFGYAKDPRIAEILKGRDPRQDLSDALGFEPEEISLTRQEALSGKAKYHHGDLPLYGLKSAVGLKLPETIRGTLDLGGLTSAEGLTFPKSIGGTLDLGKLKSAEGLKLPESIGGDLHLFGLASAEGLKLPEFIGGSLDLHSLLSINGLQWPKKVRLVKLNSELRGSPIPPGIEVLWW